MALFKRWQEPNRTIRRLEKELAAAGASITRAKAHQHEVAAMGNPDDTWRADTSLSNRQFEAAAISKRLRALYRERIRALEAEIQEVEEAIYQSDRISHWGA
jgi:hypothetical protein